MPPPARAPVPAVEAARYAPASGALTRDEMVALLSVYPWSVEEALSVAWCESQFRPWVVSVTGIHNGLFQTTHGSFDPAANVAEAWAKYQDGLNRGNRWWHWNQWGSCGHF